MILKKEISKYNSSNCHNYFQSAIHVIPSENNKINKAKAL